MALPLPPRSPSLLDWGALDRRLKCRGMPSLFHVHLETNGCNVPCPESAFETIQSTLREVDRLSQHNHSLHTALKQHKTNDSNIVNLLKTELRETKRREKEAETRAAAAQQEANAIQEAHANAKHALKTLNEDVMNLKIMVDRLQKALFAKESEVEMFRQRLTEKMDKDTQLQVDTKKHLGIIQNALNEEIVVTNRRVVLRPQTKNTSTSALSTQLKPIQVAKVYQRHLESVEEELRIARAELELFKAQSVISTNEQEGATTTMEIAAKKIAAAQSMAEAANREATIMQRELEHRPTLDEYERVQHQVATLAHRLRRYEKGNNEHGSGHAPPRLATSTSSISIQIPNKQVTAALLDRLCAALKLPDPLHLPTSIATLQRSASRVPTLQQFVDQVCTIVFSKSGTAWIPWDLRKQQDPIDVPIILEHWLHTLNTRQEQTPDRVSKLVNTTSFTRKERQQQPTHRGAGPQTATNKIIIPSSCGFPQVEVYSSSSSPSSKGHVQRTLHKISGVDRETD